ncbi:hypothetical protein ABG067_000410 [Albugo candida]
MIKRARVFQSMRLLHPLATVAKQSVIYKTYFPTLRLCRIHFQLYHASSPSYTSNRSGASPITSSTSSIEWVPSSENDWVQQLEKESDSESDEEEIFNEECLDDETKPPNDIDADAQFSKSLHKSTQNKTKKRGKHRFVDRIRIKAVGGYGGNGCCSFEAKKSFRKRPSGGHGGAGGAVIVQADSAVQDLASSTHHFKGERGQNGKPNAGAGRCGSACIFRVPCGTIVNKVIRETIGTGCEDFDITERLENICDLDRHGNQFVAAEGGKPGLGNRVLLSRTTTFGTLRNKMDEGKNLGQPGTSHHYELELKTIADVGLVGYPNAGKSTLLSRLSRASPKIAPYPFTTLHPFVGIVEFPDCYKISVADIPGLIDGAHRNVGLGHDFLRHIERTKVLLYVLDASIAENRDPLQDLFHLQRELELYRPGMTVRPSLVVANKMDQAGADENLTRLREKANLAVLPISALHKVDIDTIAKSLRQVLETQSTS